MCGTNDKETHEPRQKKEDLKKKERKRSRLEIDVTARSMSVCGYIPVCLPFFSFPFLWPITLPRLFMNNNEEPTY